MDENTTPEDQTRELFTNPEPWESWETKLVVYSLVIGGLGLVILGALINIFLL